jgi:hypothetical protein
VGLGRTIHREQLHTGVMGMQPGIPMMSVVALDLTRTGRKTGENPGNGDVVTTSMVVMVIAVLVSMIVSDAMIMDVADKLAGQQAEHERADTRERDKTSTDVLSKRPHLANAQMHPVPTPCCGANHVYSVCR